MKIVFVKALSGLLFFLTGFVFGYVYFTNKVSPLIFIPSVLFICTGIALFISAARSNSLERIVIEDSKVEAADPSIVIDTTNQKSMLERNNEIMNDWSKTYETREKLKMLKIAASAAEQDKK